MRISCLDSSTLLDVCGSLAKDVVKQAVSSILIFWLQLLSSDWLQFIFLFFRFPHIPKPQKRQIRHRGYEWNIPGQPVTKSVCLSLNLNKRLNCFTYLLLFTWFAGVGADIQSFTTKKIGSMPRYPSLQNITLSVLVEYIKQAYSILIVFCCHVAYVQFSLIFLLWLFHGSLRLK